MNEIEIKAKIIHNLQLAEKRKITPALAYDRISDDVRGPGLSLEYQEANAEKYALESGLYIVHAFSIIESASKGGRKVFNLMLDLSLHYGIKNLIFKSTDRMSRNYSDLVRIEELINNNNYRIHLYQNNMVIDQNSNYNDRFLIGIQLAVAKHLTDKLSHDIKEHNQFKAKKGIAPGVSPFGYIYDTNTKTHLIDKDAEATLRFIFDKFDSGKYSLSEMVDLLNEQGTTNKFGNGWHVSALHNLLTNPFYHGEFRYQNGTWPGNHSAYYSKDRYNQRIERLANLYVGKRTRVFEFNLARILKCECGGLYTGDFKKNKYVYYRHKCKGSKKTRYIREDELFGHIDHAIQNFDFNNNAAKLLHDLFHQYAKSERRKMDGVDRSFNRRIANIERKKERILDLYAEDEISKDTLLKKVEQLNTEIRSIKLEDRRSKITPAELLGKISDVIDSVLSVFQHYGAASNDGKAKLLKEATRRLIIERQSLRLKIQWREPLSFLLNEKFFLDDSSQPSSSVRSRGFEPLTL